MIQQQTGVLFVCLGNICRSPLAEGVFIHLARQRGVLERFRIDSCGTGGWHVGAPADRRSAAVAARHGVELPSRARQVDPRRDFETFPWIIAMDRMNQRDLIDLGADGQRVHLLRAFDASVERGGDMDVPDPYYGGPDGFDTVYEMVLAGCTGLLAHLLERGGSA